MTRRTRFALETLDDRCLPSFSPAVNLPIGTSPQDVVTADVNHDGRLDIVTANSAADTVSVLLGDGEGGFGDAIHSAAGDNPISIAVGDFNSDGTLDLAAADGGGRGVNVMFGNRDGTFRTPAHIPVGYTEYGQRGHGSLATGDFNGDGKLDLTVTSNYRADPYWYPQGRADVLLAIGNGSFSAPRTFWFMDRAVGDVAVADMNGDGKQDLVTEMPDYSVIVVLLGDGQGNIGNHPGAGSIAAWSTNPSAVGDVNGDGKTDLVTAPSEFEVEGNVGVLPGNGTGGFLIQNPEYYPVGDSPSSARLGDFDGDGTLDIVAPIPANNSVGILRGVGNGNFGSPEFCAAGPGAAVATGDFNGDGWLDVVTANAGGNNVSVLMNDQSWSPPLPTISIGGATVTEGNTGTVNATFTVSLSNPSLVDVTVNYATSDYNAAAGSDYVSTSGTLTIPAGQTSATVTVVVNGDLLAEPDEYFTVGLSNPTNATIREDVGWGTILDDEPRVRINDATVTESSTGTVYATFTLTLTSASPVDVMVNYNTADISASAGSDYVGVTGTVTIPAGQLSTTFMVAVLDDRLFEPTKSFAVNLSAATNAWIADGQGIGTILDNEPRVTINNVTRYEGNGKTTAFTFTVRLSVPYDRAVTVNYATADGTATVGGNDYVPKSGTLTFAPGETPKTITVVVKGDKTKESNETFFVNLFGASDNALLLDNQGIGTIYNDDR